MKGQCDGLAGKAGKCDYIKPDDPRLIPGIH